MMTDMNQVEKQHHICMSSLDFDSQCDNTGCLTILHMIGLTLFLGILSKWL